MEEPGFFSQALGCDAVVLGGGDIFRSDDAALAGIYRTSRQEAEASRFMRAFMLDLGLLSRAVPVFWNAVGVPLDFAPEEYCRVRKAAERARYLSVRDNASRKRLEAAGVDKDIKVVPDSSFMLGELFPKKTLVPVIQKLVASGMFPHGAKVFSVQVSFTSEEVLKDLARALLGFAKDHPNVNLVFLPIGLDHGDLDLLIRLNQMMGGRCYVVNKDLTLEDIVAVISHSNLFAGTSLHGNIAAYVYGVRNVFIAIPPYAPSKLIECARLFARESCLAASADELARLAREELALHAGTYDRPPCAGILEIVSAHFDYIAREIESAATVDRCVDLTDVEEFHSVVTNYFSETMARNSAETAELQSRLSSLESFSARSQQELQQIKNTAAWRWLSRYGALKHRYLLPILRAFRAGGRKR
jgi:hypothetical protein